MSDLSDDVFFFASNEEEEMVTVLRVGLGKFVLAGGFGEGPHFRWQPISRHRSEESAAMAAHRRTGRVRYAIIEMDRAWHGPYGPYWRRSPEEVARG